MPRNYFRKTPGSNANFYLKFPSSMFEQGTEKAYRIQLEDRKVIWIPKSQVKYLSVDGVGDEAMVSMTLPEWLVKDKEMEIWIDEDWDACGRPD